MNAQRTDGSKLALLWIVVLAAFAVALRRSTLVPWGSGEGDGALGAPLWSLMPLTGILVITVGITVSRLRKRNRNG